MRVSFQLRAADSVYFRYLFKQADMTKAEILLKVVLKHIIRTPVKLSRGDKRGSFKFIPLRIYLQQTGERTATFS
jgi:hypothetical protein